MRFDVQGARGLVRDEGYEVRQGYGLGMVTVKAAVARRIVVEVCPHNRDVGGGCAWERERVRLGICGCEVHAVVVHAGIVLESDPGLREILPGGGAEVAGVVGGRVELDVGGGSVVVEQPRYVREEVVIDGGLLHGVHPCEVPAEQCARQGDADNSHPKHAAPRKIHV